MTREAMLLKKLTNKQLLKELGQRIKDGQDEGTKSAQVKMAKLKQEVADMELRVEDLTSIISDIEDI